MVAREQVARLAGAGLSVVSDDGGSRTRQSVLKRFLIFFCSSASAALFLFLNCGALFGVVFLANFESKAWDRKLRNCDGRNLFRFSISVLFVKQKV